MISKRKAIYQFALPSLLVIMLLYAFNIINTNSFELAKEEIILRKIGHQLLLQSGDSTSRVLPIKKINEDEYQITFQNEFTFEADSLVAIIKRSLAHHKIRQDYVVNVLYPPKNEIIFGYAILGSEKDDIITCSGRKQPKNAYIISLKFQDKGLSKTQKRYLLGGLPLLAFVGLLVSKSVGRKKQLSISTHIRLGNTEFNEVDRTLTIDHTIIDLTMKESKLLSIFAKSPNLIVERSRLQKEIWEDEGVIVGRSLDVFISRLRKKLENDTYLKLITIHKKGYKLEITNG